MRIGILVCKTLDGGLMDKVVVDPHALKHGLSEEEVRHACVRR